MRKSMLFCCVLFFVGNLLAQSRWSAGVDAQIGFAGIHKNDTRGSGFSGTVSYGIEKYILQPAAGAGVWAQYLLRQGAGLRMGLGYLTSGNKERFIHYFEVSATGQQTFNADGAYSFRAHQMQMPIELTLEPGEAEVQMIFSIGAQVNANWLGTIYQENEYSDGRRSLNVWTAENSTLTGKPQLSVQPVASMGLRINDQMTIRLRHAWAKAKDLKWYRRPEGHDLINPPGGIIISNAGYRTTSSYQRLTSLQFTYRIF